LNEAAADDVWTGYLVNPLQLCFHEIGHAVVAVRCGREITRVSVNAHGGVTTSTGPASSEALLLISLAGDRAEHLAPGCIPDIIGFGPSKDQRDVDLALDHIGSDQLHRDFVLQDATEQVDHLLLAERDRLDQVARLLLKRQRLDGFELTRWLT